MESLVTYVTKIGPPKPSFTRTLYSNEWFSSAIGMKESRWMKHRGKLLRHIEECGINYGPHLEVGTAMGTWLDAGLFRTWSLGELEDMTAHNENLQEGDEESGVCFEIHRRVGRDASPVEVSCLQATMKPTEENGRIMFQVASNFNCCENGSVYSDLSSGSFVTDLMSDLTQGPAAAAQVSAITRTHAAFYDSKTSATSWGQTDGHQVELLGDPCLRDHFPVFNGKLYEGDIPKPQESWATVLERDSEKMRRAVRAGLHCDVRVSFARQSSSVCGWVSDPPLIDQCFVAALSLRASGIRGLTREEIKSKMIFLLGCAYDCTYAAAALRKSNQLVLTLIGGGVFANPWEFIAEVLAQSHLKWAPRCSRHLKKVILPLYPTGADPDVFVKALTKLGIKVTVVTWDH
eukprot:TRINITY_DN10851_c0_g1_i1.p1 TRINITY_DN10851_c0_g1~~TRINITY_DN10851_c0_g1_i1.p1  ORF type:complete len:404 (+),score=60.95 TRINITY_DN10851_c0_g1_i1:427-1638(+)